MPETTGGWGTCYPLLSLTHGVFLSFSLPQVGLQRWYRAGTSKGLLSTERKWGTPAHSTPFWACWPGLGPRAEEKNRSSSATGRHTHSSCRAGAQLTLVFVCAAPAGAGHSHNRGLVYLVHIKQHLLTHVYLHVLTRAHV